MAFRKTGSVLLLVVLSLGQSMVSSGEAVLPAGTAPEPVAVPHFPDRIHTFIWRNWPVVPPERMAKVLGTSIENVTAVGESMGLIPAAPIPAGQETRGYITVLRRNWHLLPYEQLLTLLNISADELALRLREDDFLYAKLGFLKPKCDRLEYKAPDEVAKKRAAEIKTLIQRTFGDEWTRPAEARFGFIESFAQPPSQPRPMIQEKGSQFAIRFIYPYFALYGDLLMDSELSTFPEGLLQGLADMGVNGVWVHTVLRLLAPSQTFPEFGEGHELRIANLRKLVERARKYGIDIYLYVNEPRAMPASFFEKRAQLKGVQEGEFTAMCTSMPEVRQWITDSLAYVFEQVPGLGGVFSITASENLTNCVSHYGWAQCSHCKNRPAPEIIAEVNTAIETGVHRGNPNARVIAWDWGWQDPWAADIIAKLPKTIWFMSVSEWSKPFTRGGVKGAVGEYSLSVVGPGPRATRHWKLAQEQGLKTVAKVQLNNCWEFSIIPWLPVMDLVAEHCSNLASAGVDGMMLSWTLGGYPSPNLDVARQFNQSPPPTVDTVLDRIALKRFGPKGAPNARKAWTIYSDAFREYPYDAGVLYSSPIQMGPANLLYHQPTGYAATMVGIPYDDLTRWRGPYPPDVFAEQMAKVADGFSRGLIEHRLAVTAASDKQSADAKAELRYAEVAQLHFQSTANQTRFTILRDRLLDKSKPFTAQDRQDSLNRLRQIVSDELHLALRLYTLAKEDSRIAYEASNHYFYLPIDLGEKVINCQYLLDHDLIKPQ